MIVICKEASIIELGWQGALDAQKLYEHWAGEASGSLLARDELTRHSGAAGTILWLMTGLVNPERARDTPET